MVVFLSLPVHSVSLPNAVNCELLLQPPLSQTEQPVHPLELELAGKIVDLKDPLPAINNGYFVFLVTTFGELIFADKYDSRGYLLNKKGVATHKSLLNLIKKLRPEAEKNIVLGGEGQAAFGRIIYLTNRSGNFRSSPETFDLGVRFLKWRGLQLSPRVDLLPVATDSPEPTGHSPIDRDVDEWRLENMTAFDDDVQMVKLRAFYQALQRLTEESFPAMSAEDSLLTAMRFRRAGLSVALDRPPDILYPLVTAYSRDGLEYGLRQVLSMRNDLYLNIPVQLDGVVTAAGSKLKPHMRERWRQLISEFKALNLKD